MNNINETEVIEEVVEVEETGKKSMKKKLLIGGAILAGLGAVLVGIKASRSNSEELEYVVDNTNAGYNTLEEVVVSETETEEN